MAEADIVDTSDAIYSTRRPLPIRNTEPVLLEAKENAQKMLYTRRRK